MLYAAFLWGLVWGGMFSGIYNWHWPEMFRNTLDAVQGLRAMAPLVAVCGMVVWLVVFFSLRYASVASMVAAAALPLIAYGFGEPWPVVAFAGVAAVAVVVLHRANIRRLFRGTENRFHFRRPGAPTRV